MEKPRPNEEIDRDELLSALAMNWLLAIESDDPFPKLQKINYLIDKHDFTRLEVLKAANEIMEATDGEGEAL